MPDNNPLRGDIYFIAFDQIGPHYAVVISSDALNRNTDTVIVAIATSKRTKNIYPNEFLLPTEMFPKATKVKCNSLIVWPKEELHEQNFQGSLNLREMQGLEVALMKALDLWY